MFACFTKKIHPLKSTFQIFVKLRRVTGAADPLPCSPVCYFHQAGISSRCYSNNLGRKQRQRDEEHRKEERRRDGRAHELRCFLSEREGTMRHACSVLVLAQFNGFPFWCLMWAGALVLTLWLGLELICRGGGLVRPWLTPASTLPPHVPERHHSAPRLAHLPVPRLSFRFTKSKG